MEHFIALTKALSDPNRIRALCALRSGELCVCQIIDLLGLAPSTVSKHMTILRQSGLVKCRKEERWMYYRLPTDTEIPPPVRDALAWTFDALSADGSIVNDRRILEKNAVHTINTMCKSGKKR